MKLTTCLKLQVLFFAFFASFGVLSEGLRETYIEPLEKEVGLRPEVVKLGERLFHDPILSSSRTVSCASCHNLKVGGADTLSFSKGVDGRTGKLNSPTVFNTSKHIAWFWDGRAKSLEDQIDGPIQEHLEMSNSWPVIVQRLKQDEAYSSAFISEFKEDVSAKNIKIALAEFERSLVTTNSPFDRFLRGDKSAIGPDVIEGYKLFTKYGCVSCHQGEAVGGNMFQKFGIMEKFFETKKNITKEDLGRFNVTGLEEDRHVFKVPSLRNVDLTAPYFHDGSVPTLKEAVSIMARVQLGRQLSDSEINKIIAFLKSLTGESPK